MTFYRKATALKAISQIMSYKHGTIRRYLAELRAYFGVHKTREIVAMLEAKMCVDSPVRLSPRGKEVLLLYMSGISYRQISEKLGMSLSGVRRHREKMLWQNDCESMMQLIAKYHGACGIENKKSAG